MVYAGTQTVTTEKQRVIVISTAALDADAEVGAAVDSDDKMPAKLPTHYGLVVTRTAGATALISVSLQGSLDNTNWTSIITVTAKDTQAGQSIDWGEPAEVYTTIPFRYFRNYCTTVGAGNTLTAVSYIGFS